LYSSPNIIRVIKLRRMRWAEHVTRVEEDELIEHFGGNIRRKETTLKTETQVGYNIRMDPSEIDWDNMDFFHVAQGRDKWTALVNTVMNLRVP
jgi:hypothetical protein